MLNVKHFHFKKVRITVSSRLEKFLNDADEIDA